MNFKRQLDFRLFGLHFKLSVSTYRYGYKKGDKKQEKRDENQMELFQEEKNG